MPGQWVCGVCGEGGGSRCAQGHWSRPEARFCDRCGQPLLYDEPGPATADIPVLDYADVSFADLIRDAGSQPAPRAGSAAHSGRVPVNHAPAVGEALAGNLPPVLAPQPESGARPAALNGRTLGGPDTPPEPGTTQPAPPVSGDPWQPPPPERPRRLLPALLVLVILAAVGTGAALILRPGHRPLSHPPPHHQQHGRPTPALTPTPSPSPPAVTAIWSIPSPMRGLPTANVTITGLSCRQVAQCTAVDSGGSVLQSTASGSWQVAATDPAAGLVAISCSGAGSCLAVDSAGNALLESNGSWAHPVLVDNRAGTFTAASCAGPAFCMAVDNGGNAFAYQGPGHSWTPYTVDRLGGGLTGVSCGGPDQCAAVDTGGGVYSYSDGSWSGPAAVDVGHSFTGISCATPAFCVATDNAGHAAVLQGGRWTVAPIGMSATAIACPMQGYCVATGGSGRSVTYRDGQWSAVTGIHGAKRITALSCPAAAACVATDSSGDDLYYGPGISH